jgi:hypothetical protein
MWHPIHGFGQEHFMVRSLAFSTLFLVWQLPGALAGGAKHPHMHRALHELREARTELKEASHDFGGHRVKALEAVNAAIKEIDAGLKAVGDNIKGAGKPAADIYKKYTHHPHIHHAIHELRAAHTQLKEAKHNFGGHREAALRDIHVAIEQLELALKFARKA